MDQVDDGTSLTVQPGSTVLVPNPALATIQRARPDAGAIQTAVFITLVAPTATPSTASSPSPSAPAATPVGEDDVPAAGMSFSTDAIAPEPVATMTRHTLLPGATLTLTPPGGGRSDVILSAASGDAVLSEPTPGDGRTFSASPSEQSVTAISSSPHPAPRGR